MQLQISALQNCVPGVAYAIAGIVAATVVFTKLSKSRKVCKDHGLSFWPLTRRQLDAIPTVGSNTWLGWPGHKSQINAIEVMQAGYDKVSEHTICLVMNNHTVRSTSLRRLR